MKLSTSIWLLAMACFAIATASQSQAEIAGKTAEQVAKHVWDRADGDFVMRKLTMQLIDPNGKTMTREAEVLRGIWQGVKKTRIQFNAPRRVKNTAFLTHDYLAQDQSDEQWMYLPALRRERRIPASDRGDNFMGSEFSYEDIKSELKFPLQDYTFSLAGQSDGVYQLVGTPKTAELAQELGYGKFQAAIKGSSWLPTKIKFWDTQMRPLKQVNVLSEEQVDGFWLATDIEVVNQQTGHQSRFTYEQVEYKSSLEQSLFNVSAIRK